MRLVQTQIERFAVCRDGNGPAAELYEDAREPLAKCKFVSGTAKPDRHEKHYADQEIRIPLPRRPNQERVAPSSVNP